MAEKIPPEEKDDTSSIEENAAIQKTPKPMRVRRTRRREQTPSGEAGLEHWSRKNDAPETLAARKDAYEKLMQIAEEIRKAGKEPGDFPAWEKAYHEYVEFQKALSAFEDATDPQKENRQAEAQWRYDNFIQKIGEELGANIPEGAPPMLPGQGESSALMEQAQEEIAEAGETIEEAPLADATRAEKEQTLAQLIASFSDQRGLESDFLSHGEDPRAEAEADTVPPKTPDDKAPLELTPKMEMKGEKRTKAPLEMGPSPRPAAPLEQARQTAEDIANAERMDAYQAKRAEISKSPESMREYLNGRVGALDERAKELGVLDMMRTSGEWYNRRSVWTKIGVGLGLGAGAALTAPFSAIAVAGFGSAIAAQRLLGGMGTFVKVEKKMQRQRAEQKGFWKNITEEDQAALALAYAGVSSLVKSALIGAAVGYAAEELQPVVEHWLASHWPHLAQGSNSNASATIELKPEAAAAAAKGAELPTISGGAHGYEGMVEELYARLHAPGASFVLPADHNSDLYKIMTADKNTIGAVAHKIAEDKAHNFFHVADSRSVLIEKGSTLSFDTQGNLAFDQAGAGHAVEQAVPGAQTTPALHEIRAKLGLPPKELPPLENQVEVAGYPQTPGAETISPTPEAPPAPVEAVPAPVPETPAPEVPAPLIPEAPIPQPEAQDALALNQDVSVSDALYSDQALPPETHAALIARIEESGIGPRGVNGGTESVRDFLAHAALPSPLGPTHFYHDAGNNNVVFGGDFNARLAIAYERLRSLAPGAHVLLPGADGKTTYVAWMNPKGIFGLDKAAADGTPMSDATHAQGFFARLFGSHPDSAPPIDPKGLTQTP